MTFLTLAEVARRIGCSPQTAREFCKQLPTVRVGKRSRYPEAALEGCCGAALPPSA
jgi:Helix-turn-helix domain